MIFGTRIPSLKEIRKKRGKEVFEALIVPRQSDLKFAKEKSCFSVQTLMLPWEIAGG